jgi:hypothetical protein
LGTNKRYAEAIDRRMSDRASEVVMRDAKPEGLKTSELELDKYTLSIPPHPVPVEAWVRYGGVPLRIKGEAVKWTEKVVAVQWDTPFGQHKAWLWRSAVDRR